MEDLKPCPFCGGEAEVNKFVIHGSRFMYSVLCKSCMAETYEYETEAEAIERWNTRAKKMYRMVRKPTIDPYTDRAICSGCRKSVLVSVGERMPNYCPNCGAKVIANERRKNG